jgi:Holliday junction resolvasome RuvABC endonuclease subunit
MATLLGLDPSIAKTGFCLLNSKGKDSEFLDMGRLRTNKRDGILVQRLLKQSGQIRELIRSNGVRFLAMEAPVMNSGESEELFALNQFLHKIFLEEGLEVLVFSSSRLKKLACPSGGPAEVGIHKPQMIQECRRMLKMRENPSDDAADAFWTAYLGREFYRNKYEGKAESALRADIREAFFEKKVFKRGPKKGVTEHKGMAYRINEFYYDFRKLKEAKGTYNGG